MKIHLHASRYFENWDWRNEEVGIGGSETHQIEMAWRLQRRGYEVTSYAPIPDDCTRTWKGTTWKHFEEADYSEPGLWIIYRTPDVLDHFEKGRKDQRVLFMSQDLSYGTELTEERAAKLEKYCVLSPMHRDLIGGQYPFLKDRLWITGNYGSKTEFIRELEERGDLPERNPHKLIYTSSPDRGLYELLWIFTRARELVPDLELHVYYGFDNIEKLIKYHPDFEHYKEFMEMMVRLLDRPGVHVRGRISQTELYREIFSAGIWCYPCNMFETYCINAVEAQAMGAIPITIPYGGLATNVRHGVFIEGNPKLDRLTQCRYAREVANLASNPADQEQIRQIMMPDARHVFNWERAIDQWSNFIEGMDGKYFSQFQFQARYMEGNVLNVGCGADPCDLGNLPNVTNIDISPTGPVGPVINKPHIIADARLPMPVLREYDSVILGEILEHMPEEDAIKVLKNCKAVLKNGGPIVITVPDDVRPPTTQHLTSKGDEMYAEGVSAFHSRHFQPEDLERLAATVGMKMTVLQVMDYSQMSGWGCVFRPVEE